MSDGAAYFQSRMELLQATCAFRNQEPGLDAGGCPLLVQRVYQTRVTIKKNCEPVVLLAATKWWPLSAKLAVALIRHGCAVEAVCPLGHPLHYVTGMKRLSRYHRIGSLHALEKAIAAARPELVIPCDDGVVAQLHQLHQQRPGLQALITRSLGTAAYFDVATSRERLQQVAHAMHIRVPDNKRATTVAGLHEWFDRGDRTAVLKQDGTCGGNGVRIVHSLSQATAELARMLRPQARSTTWKRMFVNRDPLALWNRTRYPVPEVTLQEYISGRPANLMMACWRGEVLGAVTVEVLSSQGETGAALVARLIHHDEIAHAACALAKELELSGFCGLDFVIEAGTGAAYLLEMNPRCTQLGHIPVANQGDLAGLISAKLGGISAHRGDRLETPGLHPGQTIAFYPKAFLCDPQSPYVSEGYADAPREEPALMRELLNPDWPDRQWPARAYHWLRPPKQEAPVLFEGRD